MLDLKAFESAVLARINASGKVLTPDQVADAMGVQSGEARSIAGSSPSYVAILASEEAGVRALRNAVVEEKRHFDSIHEAAAFASLGAADAAANEFRSASGKLFPGDPDAA